MAYPAFLILLLGTYSARFFSVGAGGIGLVLILLTIGLCLLTVKRPARHAGIFLSLIFFGLAWTYGTLRMQGRTPHSVKIANGSEITLWGQIHTIFPSSRSGQRFLLQANKVFLKESGYRLDGLFLCELQGLLPRHPGEGEQLCMRGHLKPLEVQDNYSLWLKLQGVQGILSSGCREVVLSPRRMRPAWRKPGEWLRRKLEQSLDRIPLPRDKKAFLFAMFLGEKGFLDPVFKENMRSLGVYHIFAVSGLHFGVLGLWLHRLLRTLGVSRPAANLGVLPLLLFFLAALGFPPSACRAFFMLALYFLAPFTGREVSGLQAVGVAGCMLLIWQPLQAFHAGFLFSFAAVSALLGPGMVLKDALQNIFQNTPAVHEWEPRKQNRFRMMQVGTTTLGMATVAWLGTLPLTLYYFKAFSLWSVPANLIALVVVQVAFPLTLLSGLSGLVSGGVAFVPAWCATVLLTGQGEICQWILHFPGAKVIVEHWGVPHVLGYYGIAFVLMKVLKQVLLNRGISQE